MPELSFYERQHIQKLLQQESSIKYIFDDFVRKIGIYLAGWQDPSGENLWIRNATIEKNIEIELNGLHERLLKNINNYTSDSFSRSHLKNDELVTSYIKDLSVSKLVKDGMFARNAEVLKTFLSRKVDGLSISEKVWGIAKGAKTNVEFYLSSGLATGRPATLISQDIRQLLKDPDKRFHRIRNADGKLVPSAPMKNYHPGAGKYRSSYKNAMRLAVTNTNEMYRIADHERWQNLEFILGVDIRRSHSNYGPCIICDSMVGKYPKDYLFKGWHPWCICVATPIMQKEDDFMDSLVDEDWSNAKYVQDIPSSGRNYLEEQLAKKNISLDSYLFVENKRFFQ